MAKTNKALREFLLRFPSVRDRITAAREWRGWNMTVLASRAQMSVAYVSRIEGGQRESTLAGLRKLAKAFGIPVTWLVPE